MGAYVNAIGANGDQKETGQTFGFVNRDESARLEVNKDARTRLRELRRANSKYRALVNASLEDIEEAAHDR